MKVVTSAGMTSSGLSWRKKRRSLAVRALTVVKQFIRSPQAHSNPGVHVPCCASNAAKTSADKASILQVGTCHRIECKGRGGGLVDTTQIRRRFLYKLRNMNTRTLCTEPPSQELPRVTPRSTRIMVPMRPWLHILLWYVWTGF